MVASCQGHVRTEAASAGFYASPWGQYPRVQTLTVGELLVGKKLDAPPPSQTSRTYKQAPNARHKEATWLPLDLGPTTTEP